MKVEKRSLTKQELSDIAKNFAPIDLRISDRGKTPKELLKMLEGFQIQTCVEDTETHEPILAFLGTIHEGIEHLPYPDEENVQYVLHWVNGEYRGYPLSF